MVHRFIVSRSPGKTRRSIELRIAMHFRLSLLMFLNFMILGSWAPVLSPFLEQRAFTPRQSAWIFATNALGAILGPVLWGQIADRWLASQKCISFCCLVSGTCLWWIAAGTDAMAVFWGSFAFWMFMIPALSVSASLTFRHLQHPDKEFGKVRLWGTVGWMVAGWWLGGWYALAYGPEVPPESKDWGDALRWGAAFAWLTSFYAWSLPHTPPVIVSSAAAGWLGLWTRRSKPCNFFATAPSACYASVCSGSM
jgi:MFS family permease